MNLAGAGPGRWVAAAIAAARPRVGFRVVAAALALLAVASPAWAEGKVWFPPAVTTYGRQIDQLFWLIVWITGIIFVLVEGALVWFVVRYRQRPGRAASYVHGSTMIEVIWTVVPAAIVIWLAFASQKVWSNVQGPPPPHQLEVAVTGEQFAWNIRYSGADGALDTGDDIATINQFHIPRDQVVLVHIGSKDVIHSFFVPQFRIKRDAVPGHTTRLWLQATEAGQFEIACAELCGLGHYRMRGFMVVEEPDAFQAWLAETQAQQ